MVIPYRTFPSIPLGPIDLHTFGLMVAIGIALGIAILTRHLRRFEIDPAPVEKVAVWAVAVGLVGARLTYVLTHASDYGDAPWEAFAIWQGGLQFSGGFISAAVVVGLWLRKHREISGWRVADGMGLGLTVGLAIGRLGCYSVGEHLGGETDFFLAVHYLGGATREGPIAEGVSIHNTALYEFLLLWPLFGLLLWMRKRGAPRGALISTFVLWYGVQRFLTDFLRTYDKTQMGLTGAQWVCLALIPLGAILLWKAYRRERPIAATSTTQ